MMTQVKAIEDKHSQTKHILLRRSISIETILQIITSSVKGLREKEGVKVIRDPVGQKFRKQ
jgi:hypothetical protein